MKVEVVVDGVPSGPVGLGGHGVGRRRAPGARLDVQAPAAPFAPVTGGAVLVATVTDLQRPGPAATTTGRWAAPRWRRSAGRDAQHRGRWVVGVGVGEAVRRPRRPPPARSALPRRGRAGLAAGRCQHHGHQARAPQSIGPSCAAQLIQVSVSHRRTPTRTPHRVRQGRTGASVHGPGQPRAAGAGRAPSAHQATWSGPLRGAHPTWTAALSRSAGRSRAQGGPPEGVAALSV